MQIKLATRIIPLADTSDNFLRIPMRRGHRINEIHGFVSKKAEQFRRSGSKHTSIAIERYMLPEVGATRLVQNTIKNMQSSAKVISKSRNRTATKKKGA